MHSNPNPRSRSRRGKRHPSGSTIDRMSGASPNAAPRLIRFVIGQDSINAWIPLPTHYQPHSGNCRLHICHRFSPSHQHYRIRSSFHPSTYQLSTSDRLSDRINTLAFLASLQQSSGTSLRPGNASEMCWNVRKASQPDPTASDGYRQNTIVSC